MRIGMLGSGVVGKALAKGLAKAAHDVVVGSGTPDRHDLVEWQQQSTGGAVRLGTRAEAAEHAQVAILAVQWSRVEETLAAAGTERLAGKLLIDVTNPLRPGAGGELGLSVGFDDSGAEQIARQIPDATVFKAFNTVGAELMVQPRLPGGPPTMFYAGDGEEHRTTVRQLIELLGWEPFDCGPLSRARVLEPMAQLWVEYALHSKQRNHAFKMLRG